MSSRKTFSVWIFCIGVFSLNLLSVFHTSVVTLKRLRILFSFFFSILAFLFCSSFLYPYSRDSQMIYENVVEGNVFRLDILYRCFFPLTYAVGFSYLCCDAEKSKACIFIFPFFLFWLSFSVPRFYVLTPEILRLSTRIYSRETFPVWIFHIGSFPLNLRRQFFIPLL